MSDPVEIRDVLITAVMQALKMKDADVRRGVQLGLADVPLANATPLHRAWRAYQFMQACYEPLDDGKALSPGVECGGNVLSNVPVAEWRPFLDAHPDLLARLFQRYEKNLPGIFQIGNIYVEYRPYANGEALTQGRIVL